MLVAPDTFLLRRDQFIRLFSQRLLLLKRKKINWYYFHAEIALYFEKRASNSPPKLFWLCTNQVVKIAFETYSFKF